MKPNRGILWRIATTKYNFPNIVDLEVVQCYDDKYRCRLIYKQSNLNTPQRYDTITITESEYQEYLFKKTIQLL